MVRKRKRGVKKRELFNFNNAITLLVILFLFVILKTIFIPSETVSLLLEKVKTDLTEEAEIVLDKLTNGPVEISLLSSNELIEEKIENLGRMDYEEVKNIFGIENDFCIFFEDISGNIVQIDSLNPGIGSNLIYIDGNPCE
jgi:hypothetical protein